jgi:hypothetical protein
MPHGEEGCCVRIMSMMKAIEVEFSGRSMVAASERTGTLCHSLPYADLWRVMNKHAVQHRRTEDFHAPDRTKLDRTKVSLEAPNEKIALAFANELKKVGDYSIKIEPLSPERMREIDCASAAPIDENEERVNGDDSVRAKPD